MHTKTTKISIPAPGRDVTLQTPSTPSLTHLMLPNTSIQKHRKI